MLSLSPESQALFDDLLAQIDRMGLEELKTLGEYMVSRGIETSGVRLEPAADIMKKYGEMKTTKAAEVGLSDVEFREKQRQFGETLGLQKEELAMRERQQAEQKAIYEQALREQEKARKQASKDWWKSLVGPALAIGASILFPPAAPVLFGASAAKGVSSSFSPAAAQLNPYSLLGGFNPSYSAGNDWWTGSGNILNYNKYKLY